MNKFISTLVAACAVVSAGAYTLTLNANNGLIDGNATKTITFDGSTAVDLTGEIPVRTDYKFVGWLPDTTRGRYDFSAKNEDPDTPYIEGTLICGVPWQEVAQGTSSDVTLYARWVKTATYNHFRGKKMAVLGDSVSTLDGHYPRNVDMYAGSVFYKADARVNYGIDEHVQWWGQIADVLDMDVVQVNAIGSSCAVVISHGSEPRAMCNKTRLDDLSNAGDIDVIFLAFGINDAGGTGLDIDDFDPDAPYITEPLDTTTAIFPSYAKGYSMFMRRLKARFPNAEIITLSTYHIRANADYTIVNRTAREASYYYGANPIDIYNNAWDVNRFDGVRYQPEVFGFHVGTAGFTAIANCFLDQWREICPHEHCTTNAAVAPTHATAGASKSIHCNDCDRDILSAHVIPALGHDWDAGVITTVATSEQPGVKTHHCTSASCPDAVITEPVPYAGEIVAMRNVATTTMQGVAPTLPSTVKGIYADGSLGGDFPVVWDAVEYHPGVTEVTGTANSLPVTAFVRVVAVAGDPNDPVDLLPGTVDRGLFLQPDDDRIPESWILDGKLEYMFDGNQSTGAREYIFSPHYLRLKWNDAVVITKIEWLVGLQDEGNNSYYSTDLTYNFLNDSDEIIASSHGSLWRSAMRDCCAVLNVSNTTPTKSLRFMVPEDSSEKAFRVAELRVYGYYVGGDVSVASANARPSDLLVSEKSVHNFNGDVFYYEQKCAETTGTSLYVETTNNVAVTTLRPILGMSRAVTYSEDASNSRLYSVYTQDCGHYTCTTNGVDTDPTCTTAGSVAEIVCDYCERTLQKGEVIPALDHDWTAWTTNPPPTCVDDGQRSHTCQRCSEEAHETLDALGHDWDDGEETTSPTYDSEGVMTYTCLRDGCGVTTTESIPRLAHVVVLRNAATVTEAGTPPVMPATVKGLMADGSTTNDYSVVWQTQGVSFDTAGVTNIVTGTAQVNGEQMSVTCSVRVVAAPNEGTVMLDGATVTPTTTKGVNSLNYINTAVYLDTIDVNSNVWNANNYIACIQTGVLTIDYAWPGPGVTIDTVVLYVADNYQQPDDDLLFYANGSDTPLVITDVVKTLVGSGSYHYYRREYKLANAITVTNLQVNVKQSNPGNTQALINRVWPVYIGPVTGGNSTPLASKDLDDIKVDGATFDGFASNVYDYDDVPGDDITAATAVDNMGITILHENAGTAYVVTLAENGTATSKYTVGLDPCPHLEYVTNVVAKAATCTEAGWTAEIHCKACNKTIQASVAIPATGHQHTHVDGASAATCDVAGSTGDTVCDDCGTTVQVSQPIAALGHDWDDGVVTTAPTHSSEGVMTYTCQRTGCGATKTAQIPALPDVVALRNAAIVMEAGATLTLPATVKGLLADATLVDGDYTVTWDTSNLSFNTAGVTNIVPGTALVGDEQMSVTCAVRVVAPQSGDNLVCVSSGIVPDCPHREEGSSTNHSSKGSRTALTDGNYSGTTWDSWNRYGSSPYVYSNETYTLTFDLGQPYTIHSFKIWHQNETSYDTPYVAIQTSSDNSIWSDAEKLSGSLVGELLYEYVLSADRFNARYVRILLGGNSDGIESEVPYSGFRFAKLYEIEIYGVDGGSSSGAVPLTSKDLDDIKVDGVTIEGFASDDYSYEVEGDAITAATAEDNMGITILPKNNGTAYVVTLAEDGLATATYTVEITPPHEHSYGEWVITVPATIYSEGSKTRHCTIAGCDHFETVPIPVIAREVTDWFNVQFVNYANAFATYATDPVDGGVWTRSASDAAEFVAASDPKVVEFAEDAALTYAPSPASKEGKDVTLRFKTAFKLPNDGTEPDTTDDVQTTLYAFPKNHTYCYKAWDGEAWVELSGAAPDGTLVDVRIDLRYEDVAGYPKAAKFTVGETVLTNSTGSAWIELGTDADCVESVVFDSISLEGDFSGEYFDLVPETFDYSKLIIF